MNEQLTPRNQQLQKNLCMPKSNRKESWSVYLFICLVFFNLLVFKADVQTPRAPKDVAIFLACLAYCRGINNWQKLFHMINQHLVEQSLIPFLLHSKKKHFSIESINHQASSVGQLVHQSVSNYGSSKSNYGSSNGKLWILEKLELVGLQNAWKRRRKYKCIHVERHTCKSITATYFSNGFS